MKQIVDLFGREGLGALALWFVCAEQYYSC